MVVKITGDTARHLLQVAKWSVQSVDDALGEAIELMFSAMEGDIERSESSAEELREDEKARVIAVSDPDIIRQARANAEFLGMEEHDYLHALVRDDSRALAEFRDANK